MEPIITQETSDESVHATQQEEWEWTDDMIEMILHETNPTFWWIY